VTKKNIFIRRDEAAVRSFPLSDFGDVTRNKKLVYGWLDFFNSLFAVVLFPSSCCFRSRPTFCRQAFWSLLGGFFAKYFNVD